jgi:hypothetical protein
LLALLVELGACPADGRDLGSTMLRKGRGRLALLAASMLSSAMKMEGSLPDPERVL